MCDKKFWVVEYGNENTPFLVFIAQRFFNKSISSTSDENTDLCTLFYFFIWTSNGTLFFQYPVVPSVAVLLLLTKGR